MKFKTTTSNLHMGRSGVFMGGIGAGGFEVRPDGRFDYCSIADAMIDRPPFDLFFFFHHKGTEHVLSLHDLVQPGIGSVGPAVQSIIWEGNFPNVKLTFPGLPVSIEFMSFFIPGNLKDSALPAVRIKVKGDGELYIAASLRGKNSIDLGKNRIIQQYDQGELGFHTKNGKAFYASKRTISASKIHWASGESIPGW